jgi:hypothetical protein
MTLGKRLLVSTLCTFNALTIQVITQSVVPLPIRAQGTCSELQLAEGRARTVVQTDTAGINQLKTGFAVTSAALDDFLKLTTEQRSRLYQTALLNLLQAATAAPFIGVNVGNVALPNGVASIGTGQANALIQLLRSKGVGNPALFSLISGAASVSGKPALAKTGQAIVGTSITALQGGSAALKGDVVGAWASVAQLGLSLMGPAYAGYATALGAGGDFLTLVQSGVVASNAASQISQLGQLNAANLAELKRRVAKLQVDVQALQSAKAQSSRCTSSGGNMPTDIEACRHANEICAAINGASYCPDARSLCERCIGRRAADRAFLPGTLAWVQNREALTKQLLAVQGYGPEANAERRRISNEIKAADAQQKSARDEEDAKLESTGLIRADRAKCGVRTDELWLGYSGTLPSGFYYNPN